MFRQEGLYRTVLTIKHAVFRSTEFGIFKTTLRFCQERNIMHSKEIEKWLFEVNDIVTAEAKQADQVLRIHEFKCSTSERKMNNVLSGEINVVIQDCNRICRIQ